MGGAGTCECWELRGAGKGACCANTQKGPDALVQDYVRPSVSKSLSTGAREAEDGEEVSGGSRHGEERI